MEATKNDTSVDSVKNQLNVSINFLEQMKDCLQIEIVKLKKIHDELQPNQKLNEMQRQLKQFLGANLFDKRLIQLSDHLNSLVLGKYQIRKVQKVQVVNKWIQDLLENDLLQSDILHTKTQADQLVQKLQSLHRDCSKIKLIHKTKFDFWGLKDFWDACKEFQITICLIKAQNGRILGCYSPTKWKECNGPLQPIEVKKGKTFAFFFDEDLLRICESQVKGSDYILSTKHTPLCLYGNDTHTNTLSIGGNRSNKFPDFARVRDDSTHTYPKQTSTQLNQDSLHFAEDNSPYFRARMMEVYGLEIIMEKKNNI